MIIRCALVGRCKTQINYLFWSWLVPIGKPRAAGLKSTCFLERGFMEILYSMINNALDLPAEIKHALANLNHEQDFF